MNIKLITSASALALALALSGPAFAQTMIGSQTVSAEDLPKVQAQCDTLASVPPQSLAEDSENDENNTPGASMDAPSPAGSAVDSTQTAPNATAQAGTTVKLESVTLDQCVEAGLAKAAQ